MHTFSGPIVASLALLSSLLTGVVAQPANIGRTPELQQYEEFIARKLQAEKNLNGPMELDTSRRSGGFNLRNHGHKHAHKHTHVQKPAVTKRGSGDIAAPAVSGVSYLGPTTNNPSLYYFQPQPQPGLPDLTTTAPALLIVNTSVVGPLANDYPMFNGTGTMSLTTQNENNLYRLATVPSISRDSGKGGYLNGTKMFIFADSEVFTAPGTANAGSFTGFVSNSVTTDYGFNAADGQAPALRDRVGVWVGVNGGLRGFIPWTEGEEAYNYAMVGKGGRVAIWPSSSITLLTENVAIQYSPIVYIDTVGGSYSFSQVGATAYTITVPNSRSGPAADRIAPYLWPTTQACWGCLGGLRSWGADGVGGSEGWLYLFADNAEGLLLARVNPTQVANQGSYEYYYPSTNSWTNVETTEVFLTGSYSSSDIFYSPYHQTFINVFADRYVDNAILWRYLIVPEGGITPVYDGSDFASAIYNSDYEWSAGQTLYNAPAPAVEYIYSSGPNLGYFEDDDITNGGTKMLIHWTAPTGQGANTATTSFNIPAAVVTWE